MSEYPHRCPACSSPAYVGAYAVKCTNVWCKHYEPPKFEYPKLEGELYSVTWSNESSYVYKAQAYSVALVLKMVDGRPKWVTL